MCRTPIITNLCEVGKKFCCMGFRWGRKKKTNVPPGLKFYPPCTDTLLEGRKSGAGLSLPVGWVLIREKRRETMNDSILAVFFKSREENYAVEISSVEKIIEYEVPKPIPESSEYLTGVIRYQENVLPVIDINMRFYQKKEQDRPTSKILIVNTEDLKVGLLVDEVLGISGVQPDELETSEAEIYGVAKAYMKGFIKKEKEITILLDPDSIFSEVQFQELESLAVS